MPKDTRKHEHQPTFYDHSERPFLSREIATASNVTGSSSSHFVSQPVTGTLAPAPTEDYASTYPVPMDVDEYGVDDEVPPLAEAGPALYTGLPGIKVVPVPRKRYKNSVSMF